MVSDAALIHASLNCRMTIGFISEGNYTHADVNINGEEDVMCWNGTHSNRPALPHDVTLD